MLPYYTLLSEYEDLMENRVRYNLTFFQLFAKAVMKLYEGEIFGRKVIFFRIGREYTFNAGEFNLMMNIVSVMTNKHVAKFWYTLFVNRDFYPELRLRVNNGRFKNWIFKYETISDEKVISVSLTDEDIDELLNLVAGDPVGHHKELDILIEISDIVFSRRTLGVDAIVLEKKLTEYILTIENVEESDKIFNFTLELAAYFLIEGMEKLK
jgi:hypothetical protein